ncbi:MAG: hypothetical protein QHC79_09580 [Pseudosphingobacterium sp.]|nr:hypothetical protein [Pseudosphingobacterium sp.]
MQEIQAWFKNSDYREGVDLYNKYGSNSFLKKLFASGPTEYNLTKLREELQAICPTQNPENSQIHVTKSDNSVTKAEESVTNSQNSNNSEKSDTKPSPKLFEYYTQLQKQKQQINRQIERNMSLLDTSRSKNVRFEAAKQILQLDSRKRGIWAKIDYYEEHGRFPDPVALQPVKTDELQRLYVQISKAEKRLKSDKVKDPEKTQKLIDEKRLRLDELKRERGML